MIQPIRYNPNAVEHTIDLVIEGEPVGKGRPRVTNRGSFAHAYNPAKTKNYEKLIQNEYFKNYTYEDTLQGPIKAELIAYFPVPESTSKKKKELLLKNYEKHTKKPDIDNVIKSVFDALNNVAFTDDSNIIELKAKKLYSDQPRVELHLKEVKYDILNSRTD